MDLLVSVELYTHKKFMKSISLSMNYALKSAVEAMQCMLENVWL